jgi:hypothetical protein
VVKQRCTFEAFGVAGTGSPGTIDSDSSAQPIAIRTRNLNLIADD